MAKNDITPAPKTRTRKSAAEKAQADLDRAQKAVDKANDSVQKYEFALAESKKRQVEATRYLDYVSRNPALLQDGAEQDVPQSGDSTST